MIFDWEAANVEHIARHGVTSEECEEAQDPVVTAYPMHPRQREIYRGEQ
jgi:hypothetical protein